MQGNFKLNPSVAVPLGFPDQGGTVVWEVDDKGNQVGPEYYTRGWTNRNAPATRATEASPQWIEEMVVATTRAAAALGVDSGHIDENLPLNKLRGAIASSSPFNRDVLVKLVDGQGNEVTRFTMAFLTVVDAKPTADSLDCIAQKILVSNSNILAKPNFTIGAEGRPVFPNP